MKLTSTNSSRILENDLKLLPHTKPRFGLAVIARGNAPDTISNSEVKTLSADGTSS